MSTTTAPILVTGGTGVAPKGPPGQKKATDEDEEEEEQQEVEAHLVDL